MTPIDLISCLVSDELMHRSDRLLERRRKVAAFRDPQVTLDNFDFNFNKKMNRSLVFDLATAHFIAKHEDALFLGPPGTGKSHLAQAIGLAAIQQGYRVLYRETHTLINDIVETELDGTRKEHMELLLSTVPLLIIDDLGMRKLPPTAAEDLLEIVMRRYERASTLLTSNRPIEDWGKLLGDTAAVTAMLDRLPPASRSRPKMRAAELANSNAIAQAGSEGIEKAAVLGSITTMIVVYRRSWCDILSASDGQWMRALAPVSAYAWREVHLFACFVNIDTAYLTVSI
jgi:DNA replication protein DnaC